MIAVRFLGLFVVSSLSMTFVASSKTIKCPPGQVAETVSRGIFGSALGSGPFEVCSDIKGSTPPISVSPPEPTDTSDEGTVEIKLADPDDAELGDIDTFFYRVAIPPGKKLALMKKPSLKSKVMATLANGTRNIKLRKLGYAGGRKWANLCTSGKCGWAIARHFRRQERRSSNRGTLMEVAFPEINIFVRPSVESRIVRTLVEGSRVALKKTRSDKHGEGWVRVCGSGWCGWAGKEFFAPAR